jgi:tetratricopeptide (TPR) repeat protein
VSNLEVLTTAAAFDRLIPLLALTAVLAGCASRREVPVAPAATAPVTSPAVPPPVNIPALIERGCFSCLQMALAAARERGTTDLVFEASALLTVRAKELGLPYEEWLATATTAAASDPARAVLVEIIEAIPLDPLSGAREEVFLRLAPRMRGPAAAAWLDSLKTAPVSPVVRGYLELALRCNGAGSPERPDTTIEAGIREIPIVKYRLGICGNAYASELRDVRAADPEFHDVDYALGRYARQTQPYPDLDEAIRRLEAAATAFPESSAIATSLGDTLESIEEWTAALRAFDAAIALVPDHPDALRGRLVSLSSLNEHVAAIETATRMMQGRWHLGDAYYWRAWNHLQLGNLEDARADRDRMKALRVNSRVYLLSGLIDWRLRRLEPAEIEFEESVALEAGQCEASTFLGGVRNERGKSPEALAAFTFSKRCWELTITVRREAIKVIQSSEAPESYKTREIARHERGIAQAEKRRDEAANGIDLLQKYLSAIQGPQSPQRQ